jgi:hypothetical protein
MTQSAKKNEELEVPSGGIGAFAMSEDDVKAIQEAEAEQEFGTQGLGQFSAVAKRMAGYGRFGDDSIAHVQTGEIIIPLALIENNSKLKEQIFQSFRDQGIQDPERYVVGSGGNYINPETGQMEFFGPGWVKAWNKVKGVLGTVVKIALPLALAATPLGPIYGAAMGSGIATLLTGGTVKEALNSALVSGATGAVMVGVSGGGLEGVGKALKDPVSRVSQTAKGAFNGDTKLFRSFVPKEETAGTLERLGGKADAKIGETFFPEDVTPDQVLQRGTNPIDPMDATPTQWDRAKTIAKQESPGMLRKTAPWALATAAVVGGAESLGAFDEEEPEDLIDQTTGQDLIDADPDKYEIKLPDYTAVDYGSVVVPTSYPSAAPIDVPETDVAIADPIGVPETDVAIADPVEDDFNYTNLPPAAPGFESSANYVMSSTPLGPFALPQVAQMSDGGPVQYFADGGETQVDVSGSAGYRPAVDTTKPAAPKKKKKNKNPNREAAYAKAIQDAIAKKEQEKEEAAELAKQELKDKVIADQIIADQEAADLQITLPPPVLVEEQVIAEPGPVDPRIAEAEQKLRTNEILLAEKLAEEQETAARLEAERVAQAEVDRLAAEQAEIARLAAEQAAREEFAQNWFEKNPRQERQYTPNPAPTPAPARQRDPQAPYNPEQEAQILANSSSASNPFVYNNPLGPTDAPLQNPFGLDYYADYNTLSDPFAPIDFTVPQVVAAPVPQNDYTLYADNPFYQAVADGGPIFPRREGGIAPTEGTPGKDSVRAMLMPGEFIMTTDAVKGLGNGNNEKGIQNMYAVMRNLENRGRNT